MSCKSCNSLSVMGAQTPAGFFCLECITNGEALTSLLGKDKEPDDVFIVDQIDCLNELEAVFNMQRAKLEVRESPFLGNVIDMLNDVKKLKQELLGVQKVRKARMHGAPFAH